MVDAVPPSTCESTDTVTLVSGVLWKLTVASFPPHSDSATVARASWQVQVTVSPAETPIEAGSLPSLQVADTFAAASHRSEPRVKPASGVSEMCSERPTRAGQARLIDNAGLGVRPGGT